MHAAAYHFVAELLKGYPRRRSVVEIGSRDINGSVRDLFGDAEYVGIDRQPGRGVDVVADGVSWQPARPVDTVVCCEVLEHCENAASLISNAYEMLVDGGLLIVTAASRTRQPHGCDGGPVGDEHFRAVTLPDLAGWLQPFRKKGKIEDSTKGDIYAWAVK
jgi:hypothetical protein